jgi:uncharacterized protein YcfJ
MNFNIMSHKNKVLSVVISAGFILSGVGCASDTGNGALIGGGVGALAGGIIGHQSGNAVGGALIGGAVGAGTGALIGHASDENKKDKREAYDKGYYEAQRDNARSTPNTQRDGYYGR